MRRKTKQIQQEEAALSILMDVHAEHAGQQLWQEFEQAQASGAAPKLSNRQERKWRRAAGLNHAVFWNKTLAVAGKVALWAVAMIAFATITIVAADAGGLVDIQTPLWDGYFVSNHKETITVHFAPVDPVKPQDEEAVRRAVAEHVPEGFTCAVEYATYTGKSVPGFYTMYSNEEDGKIILNSRAPGSGLLKIDKNGAEVSEIKYLGRDMVLLTRSDGWQLVWMDEEEGLCYSIYADNIREDDYWILVNAVLQREKGTAK